MLGTVPTKPKEFIHEHIWISAYSLYDPPCLYSLSLGDLDTTYMLSISPLSFRPVDPTTCLTFPPGCQVSQT